MALEDAAKQMDMAFTREDLKGPSYELTFGGATSFLRRKYTKDLTGVDIAVTGVPLIRPSPTAPAPALAPAPSARQARCKRPTRPMAGTLTC